ncbi:DEAD/DEAH box helicase [Clostridium sediminicola]|uniref:helicase-associated domain-containing protein n=1 Tax=Clostridium sediminicola TaxID=3114879 RepID=UPI0031F209C5
MERRCIAVNNDRKIYIYQDDISKNSVVYEAESQIYLFATLVKSPHRIHTYVVDSDSLWSAAALSISKEFIVETLSKYSKNKISKKIKEYIGKKIREFWTVEMHVSNNIVILGKEDVVSLIEEELDKAKITVVKMDEHRLKLDLKDIELIKRKILKLNMYIVEVNGALEERALDFKVNCSLYRYQEFGLEKIFNLKNNKVNARGIVTMPPGSGKTIIGLKVIEKLKVKTLIIVQNDYSYENWVDQIREKTNYQEDIIMNSENKGFIDIYKYDEAQNLLTEKYQNKWGLIIYDDARKLPTTKNKKTVYISSKFKLALGSYIERDGKEEKIYRAIGPKLFNITLNEMEYKYGQIPVECNLVLLPIKDFKPVKGENDLKQIVLQNLEKKIEALRIIEHMKQDKKIYYSHFIHVAKEINKYCGDSKLLYGVGKNLNEEEFKNIVLDFNAGIIKKLVATQIIERLQLNDIDTMITLAIRGESSRDEYIRIGKLKSSNPLDCEKKGYYYALIIKDSKEEATYYKTMKKMLNYGFKYIILSLDELRDRIENQRIAR